MTQILSSAYIMGARSDRLNKIYEEESKELDRWADSPCEVSKHDWRVYLGDPRLVNTLLISSESV